MKEVPNPLTEAVIRAGFAKTIYARVMPETEAVVDAVIGESRRAALHDMYRGAWTHKQDGMDQEFFDVWRDWTRPVVEADWSRFGFLYPTAGASEGLRAAIEEYGNRAREARSEPVIHIFTGEYEGYKAYAQAAHIRVVEHERSSWRSTLELVGPDHQFYISQPSAIDGGVWGDYDAFVQSLLATQPTARVMLDVTYVGAVARAFRIVADYPNVAVVFFSLSKPAGMYYQRIGGMLSRTPYDSMFGNMWFKNLLSIAIGTAWMKAHGVHDMPSKYRQQQGAATVSASRALGLDLRPCDVFVLATAAVSRDPSELERHLTRPTGPGTGIVRVCLTPTMAEMIGTSPTVMA